MAATQLRDACAIVGIGQTEFSRNSGRTEVALAAEASKKAIEDAGLAFEDIDGVISCDNDSTTNQAIVTALGLPNMSYRAIIAQGGAAPAGMVATAAAAIHAGLASNVICFRSLNGYSETRYGQASATRTERVGGRGSYNEYYVPYGMVSAAQFYGITARRHMLEYGTTKDHLGIIATSIRANANKTPHAQMYSRPMSMDDYYSIRTIADPLNLFDCCQETDGACAVIVSSSERAKDLRQVPAYIRGAAMGSGPQPQGGVWFPCMARQSITDLPAAEHAARDLYTMAGVGPEDIDVAQIYDCFTITVMLQFAAYGFCKKGDVGGFLESGAIGADGRLPVNTAGGNLSEGYIHGMNHVVEGVKQIRGTASNQVKDAEFCLVTSAPHPPTSALILRR